MANKGPMFVTGDYLREGDFLQSANGFFCAYLHEDGNLCIYRSPTPDAHTNLWCSGKTTTQGAKCAYLHDNGDLCIYNSACPDGNTTMWCSKSYAPAGKKCAYLHDNGDLCIYNSAYPDGNTTMWRSRSVDPVIDFEIVDLTYDVARATTTAHSEPVIYRQTVHNATGIPQTSTISGSESVSETSGWSDTLGVKVGVSTTFKTGVPVIAEGKITVSAEISNTYTWNGSTTKTKTWGFSSPVTVPAHKTCICLVSVNNDTLVVPYTMTGTAIFQSGARLPGQKVNGTFSGNCSHDLSVTFAEQDAITGLISYTRSPIEAL